MTRDETAHAYFEWLYAYVCKDRFAPTISYRRLLTRLHDIDFRYSIQKDKNRAVDGMDLRYRFALRCAEDPIELDDIVNMLRRPCTVLEMMVALAIRAENSIMDDASVGDRTAHWFWKMIANLGLGASTDGNYDPRLVDDIIDRFLDRRYSRDGTGGLFTVMDCDYDLRDVEIWYQLCWYLDSIT